LIGLIYVSKAVTVFKEEELLGLLFKARPKNRGLGITGLLLYKAGNFIQLLEGERDVVMRLFQEISCDPRHCNILCVLNAGIPAREFPEWSMGFKNLDTLKPGDVPGYSDFMDVPLTVEEFDKDRSRALNLLTLFKLS
jgi:hypothetical protein